MNKKMFLTAGMVLSMIACVAAVPWKINSDAEIHFSTKAANGSLKGMHGKIVFDEKDLASSMFDVSVPVKDIATGIFLKNNHARGKKWLDADQYPQIRFVASHIRSTASGYVAVGKLTLHGITKEINIPFTFVQKGNTGTFSGHFSVKRLDYAIGVGQGTVGDVIDIQVTVPVTR